MPDCAPSFGSPKVAEGPPARGLICALPVNRLICLKAPAKCSSRESETSQGFGLWPKQGTFVERLSPSASGRSGANTTFCRNEHEWPVCALRPAGLEQNKDTERDQDHGEGNEADRHEIALLDSPE